MTSQTHFLSGDSLGGTPWSALFGPLRWSSHRCHSHAGHAWSLHGNCHSSTMFHGWFDPRDGIFCCKLIYSHDSCGAGKSDRWRVSLPFVGCWTLSRGNRSLPFFSLCLERVVKGTAYPFSPAAGRSRLEKLRRELLLVSLRSVWDG